MVSSPYAILTLLNDVSYSMYKERIVIGRGTPDAPVDLHVGESTFISRRHLELVWKSNTLRLTCNGKNGIFVDKDFRPNDPVARSLPACCVLRFPSTSICIRIEQCRLRSSRRSSVLRRRRRPLGDHQTTSESENSGSNDESPSPAKKSKNNSATDSLCCEVQETADHISSVSNCLTSKSGTRRKQALVPSKPSLAPQISDEPACMNEHSTNIEKPMIDPSTPSKPPTQEVTNVAQTAFTLSSMSFPVSVNTSCTAVLNHLTPTVLGVSSLTHIERGDKTHKPPYSYAQLIAQAIASRPDRQVTLSGIYSYISQNYPYYQAQDKGWQNSVRHNLSLNRYFLKVPRTQDDHGKGCFWRIDPTVESKMVALAFRKRRSRAYSSVVFTPSLMSGVRLAPLERAHSVSAASPYGYTPLRTLASKVVVVGGNKQDAGGEAGIVGFIPNSTIHVASVAGSTQTLSPKSQWTGPTQEVIPVVTSNSQVLRPKRIIVCYPNTNRQ